MIATLMVYCLVVAALLGSAAHALESLLRSYGRPARFIWVSAVIGSIALPVLAWLAPNVPAPVPAGSGLASTGETLAAWQIPIDTLSGAVSRLDSLNVVLVSVWILVSLALATTVLWSFSKLAHERRRCCLLYTSDAADE